VLKNTLIIDLGSPGAEINDFLVFSYFCFHFLKTLGLLHEVVGILNCILYLPGFLTYFSLIMLVHLMNKLNKKWWCFNFEKVPYLKLRICYGLYWDNWGIAPLLSVLLAGAAFLPSACIIILLNCQFALKYF